MATSTPTSIPTPAQLAERRKALRISQARLAELIRAHYVTISHWETGEHALPPKRAKQIDAALTVMEAAYKVAAEVAGKAGQP